jgi:ribonuclease R
LSRRTSRNKGGSSKKPRRGSSSGKPIQITQRKILEELRYFYRKYKGKPVTAITLGKRLGIQKEHTEKQEELRTLLKTVVRNGDATRTQSGTYALVPQTHSRNRGEASGDPSNKKLRQRGSFQERTGRNNKEAGPSKLPSMIGQIVEKKGRSYVISKELQTTESHKYHRLWVPKKYLGDAKEGDTVVVSVVEMEGKAPWAKVVHRVFRDSFKDFYKKFLKEHRLSKKFPPLPEREAAAFKEPTMDEYPHREDFRGDVVITIDPYGARDHDDAIGIVPLEDGGWIVRVHIADVAEYVTEHTGLDREAQYRAYTRYFPWKSVPMLPARLSADLCSLREGCERLALTCEVTLSSSGVVREFRFTESVVQVHKFYTYEEAWDLYQQKDPLLSTVAEVAHKLALVRKKKGLLDFDVPEPHVSLNAAGEPESMGLKERVPSYGWIEEFMLLANQCTAKWMKQQKLPGMYRVHELLELEDMYQMVDLDQLEDAAQYKPALVEAIRNLPVPKNNVHSKYRDIYVSFLKRVHKKHKENPSAITSSLQKKVLRTMKKAMYSTTCAGHFALGFLYYAHFTSPIRRYADLWNHRYIKQKLRKEKIPKSTAEMADSIAEKISETEVKVIKLERKSMRSAMAWILQDHVGSVFPAEVCELGDKGMAVLVQNEWLYGEGWIPLFSLRDDYYEYDERANILVGKRTKRCFSLYDPVQVRLEKVDPVLSLVEFEVL